MLNELKGVCDAFKALRSAKVARMTWERMRTVKNLQSLVPSLKWLQYLQLDAHVVFNRTDE